MKESLLTNECQAIFKSYFVRVYVRFTLPPSRLTCSHTSPHHLFRYRVVIKCCVFSLKSCDFSKLCQFCCSAGVRPAIWRTKREVQCTHADTESGIYFKILEKTQYLMNTLYLFIVLCHTYFNS